MINPLTGNCINETVEPAEKTCPEGQYLNALTGRCKSIATTTTSECKEGYYRNPETGRCKKIETATSAEVTPCAEGYERNPDTGRCRKIRTNDASEYPVEPISTESYENPKIFIAAWALLALGILVIAYVIFQFRHEIAKLLRRIKIKRTSL